MVEWKVPFLNDNMVHYADSWVINNPNFKGKFEFKDRYEFDDELAYIKCEQGRSRVTFTLESTKDNRQYDTTLNGFIDMVNKGTVRQMGNKILIAGRFGFAKKGSTVATILIK